MGTALARTGLRIVSDQDVLTWNLLIGACVQNAQAKEAVELFKHMQCQSVLTDKVSLVSLVSACAKLSSLFYGKCMHAIIKFTEWDLDVVINTALVSMYGKCGDLHDALRCFDIMPAKNLVTWNAIISTAIRLGDVHQACELFNSMQVDGVHPNRTTFITILEGNDSNLELHDGRKLHDVIVRNGLFDDVVLATVLMNMYGRHDRILEARRVFDFIPRRDLLSWSSMIALYSCQGLGGEACSLYEQMKQESIMPDNVTFVSVLDACAVQPDIVEGKKVHACIKQGVSEPDVVLLTSLMNMYAKCKDAKSAMNVFDDVCQPNAVSWNTVLAMHAHFGRGEESFQVFSNMQQAGAMPNYVTFTSVLDGCASVATLREGKRLHTTIMATEVRYHVNVQTALVNMYGKCGSLDTALEIFHGIVEPNVVTWTTIISVFSLHGQGRKAMQLFHQMQNGGIRPDTVTFVSILSACRHAGLIKEAYYLLNVMVQEYGLRPDEKHHECVIDLLGRTGQLDEAEQLINNVPHIPTAVAWTSLLGSCRDPVDVERGERAALSMMKINAGETAPYVTLSNLYCVAGRREDAEKLLCQMKSRDVNVCLEALA